jgi:hypothetical protein
MGSPRDRRVDRHEDPMAQIRFDNLGGPLLGPLLSLGIGFGFPGHAALQERRAPDRSPNDATVNPLIVMFR